MEFGLYGRLSCRISYRAAVKLLCGYACIIYRYMVKKDTVIVHEAFWFPGG